MKIELASNEEKVTIILKIQAKLPASFSGSLFQLTIVLAGVCHKNQTWGLISYGKRWPKLFGLVISLVIEDSSREFHSVVVLAISFSRCSGAELLLVSEKVASR